MSPRIVGLLVLAVIGIGMALFEELVDLPRTRRKYEEKIRTFENRGKFSNRLDPVFDQQVADLKQVYSLLIKACHRVALAGILVTLVSIFFAVTQ